MMKNVQQIRTMFPIGFSDDNNVCTTNFSPGALLITRSGLRARTNRNTLRMPNILLWDPKMTVIVVSITDISTNEPSIMFQPDLK